MSRKKPRDQRPSAKGRAARVDHDVDHEQDKLARAVQLHQAGDFDQAAALYQQVLARQPRQPDALHLLGVIAHQSGDHARAIELIEQAVSVDGGNPHFLANLGSAQQSLGQIEPARASYDAAIRLHPNFATAHNNLGNLHLGQHQWEAAIACYRAALQLEPKSPLTLNNLGNALREQRDWAAAIDCYQQAIQLNPKFVPAWINLGTALSSSGRYADAVECFRQAIRFQPDNAEAHFNLGNVYQQQGDFEAAQREYTEVLRINPLNAKAQYNLSFTKKFSAADKSTIAQIEECVSRPALSADDEIHLRFALGKIYDDCKDFDKAFEQFRRANELARPRFDRAEHERLISDIIETFTADRLAESPNKGHASELPIFIVGMPRSGTTLVEQIISSHPTAVGAGELDEIGRLAVGLQSALGSSHEYPLCIPELTPDHLRRLAGEYVARLESFASAETTRVTDKMPMNFLHLGFIALLLPNARVIHCRRHPFDVCLSCYFQHFESRLAFTYDLGDLAFYYQQYERLMSHWRTVLPTTMLEVEYERLVQEPEPESRRIIEFCGLSWDDRCLQFHQHGGAVRTASSWQVRQPIYASSKQRWKNYEQHLGELIATGLIE